MDFGVTGKCKKPGSSAFANSPTLNARFPKTPNTMIRAGWKLFACLGFCALLCTGACACADGNDSDSPERPDNPAESVTAEDAPTTQQQTPSEIAPANDIEQPGTVELAEREQPPAPSGRPDRAGQPEPAAQSAQPSEPEQSSAYEQTAESKTSGRPAKEEPVAYPRGWLVVPVDEIPAETAVNIVYLPGMDAPAHRTGEPVSAEDQSALDAAIPLPRADRAIVEYEGTYAEVDDAVLLVNLPDVLPQASYDIVYSYASTSNCAGWDIPGVTGMRLQGYADGRQPSAYWEAEQFAVPCSLPTARKAMVACDLLNQSGYRLLVFDAYRPMTAQWQLSDAFSQACAENIDMAYGLGDWGMGWYVAQGSSGHNYGTDLDVGACDAEGNPCDMPSSFDAFDETGHLTLYPVDAGSITPDSYRDAVLQNDACMALHDAFRDAGFTELASEWWHFGDPETEAAVRALVGDAGLDFTATIE